MTQFERDPSSEKGTLDTSDRHLSRPQIRIRSHQDSCEFLHLRLDRLLGWRNSLRLHGRFRQQLLERRSLNLKPPGRPSHLRAETERLKRGQQGFLIQK